MQDEARANKRYKANKRPNAAFLSPTVPRSAFFRAKVASAGVQPLQQRLQDRALIGHLRCFDLLSGLPLTALKEVAADTTLCTYRRGEFLWQRGDLAKHVVLIDSGFVKMTRRDRDGASKTYGLFGPGDSLGIFAFWAGMRYPSDAVALNRGVTLLVIDAIKLARLPERYPVLADRLQAGVIRFTEAFIDKIEIVSAGNIPQRLAMLMIQLVDRYGVNRSSEQAYLPLCLPLEQISEILGARIETVARCLAQWKRAGWLSTDAHGCHFTHLEKVRELLLNCNGDSVSRQS
ncbi:cAMP receptor protein [mine drainage metagenome]|uniref:cAMP receptor protein n=1 Tax=mine drainage metagenome TaxID=410659 RepID=A0A1J5RS19_9ZZZZ